MILTIYCAEPNHLLRKGEEGWETLLGEVELPDGAPDDQQKRATDGYRCEACAQADAIFRSELPLAPTLPTAAEIRHAVMGASSIEDIKEALTVLLGGSALPETE